MKKQKLNLSTLRVKSFVTDLSELNSKAIYAGNGADTIESCIICEEPAPSVGCPVETFHTACATDVYC